MADSFVKLYGSILDSSVWLEDHATVRVWITMLAMAHEDGVARSSVGGLARRAHVTAAEAETALAKFLGPDPDSRNPEHEGRRIEKVEGGWLLLNHHKYRQIRTKAQILTAKRVQRWRDRHGNDVTPGNDGNATKRSVTVTLPPLTSSPSSPSDSPNNPSSFPPTTKQTIPQPPASVLAVFDHWKTVMGHPDARLTSKRQNLVKARLKDGYSVEDLKAAVDGCKASDFHQGKNGSAKVYDDLALICRDGEHVEQFKNGNGHSEGETWIGGIRLK